MYNRCVIILQIVVTASLYTWCRASWESPVWVDQSSVHLQPTGAHGICTPMCKPVYHHQRQFECLQPSLKPQSRSTKNNLKYSWPLGEQQEKPQAFP